MDRRAGILKKDTEGKKAVSFEMKSGFREAESTLKNEVMEGSRHEKNLKMAGKNRRQ